MEPERRPFREDSNVYLSGSSLVFGVFHLTQNKQPPLYDPKIAVGCRIYLFRQTAPKASKSTYGCFYKLGVNFLGVLMIRALLFTGLTLLISDTPLSAGIASKNFSQPID